MKKIRLKVGDKIELDDKTRCTIKVILASDKTGMLIKDETGEIRFFSNAQAKK